jgi:hypothetical protein
MRPKQGIRVKNFDGLSPWRMDNQGAVGNDSKTEKEKQEHNRNLTTLDHRVHGKPIV